MKTSPCLPPPESARRQAHLRRAAGLCQFAGLLTSIVFFAAGLMGTSRYLPDIWWLRLATTLGLSWLSWFVLVMSTRLYLAGLRRSYAGKASR